MSKRNRVHGEKYYAVVEDSMGSIEVFCFNNEDTDTDNKRYENGNYFEDPIFATKALNEILNIFKHYKSNL